MGHCASKSVEHSLQPLVLPSSAAAAAATLLFDSPEQVENGVLEFCEQIASWGIHNATFLFAATRSGISTRSLQVTLYAREAEVMWELGGETTISTHKFQRLVPQRASLDPCWITHNLLRIAPLFDHRFTQLLRLAKEGNTSTSCGSGGFKRQVIQTCTRTEDRFESHAVVEFCSMAKVDLNSKELFALAHNIVFAAQVFDQFQFVASKIKTMAHVWFSHMDQDPRIVPHVELAFVGKQECGKTNVLRAFEATALGYFPSHSRILVRRNGKQRPKRRVIDIVSSHCSPILLTVHDMPAWFADDNDGGDIVRVISDERAAATHVVWVVECKDLHNKHELRQTFAAFTKRPIAILVTRCEDVTFWKDARQINEVHELGNKVMDMFRYEFHCWVPVLLVETTTSEFPRMQERCACVIEALVGLAAFSST